MSMVKWIALFMATDTWIQRDTCTIKLIKNFPKRLMDLFKNKFIISIREILKFETYFLFLSWKVEVCILILLFPVGIETDTEETPPSKKSKKEKRSMEESFNYSIQII